MKNTLSDMNGHANAIQEKLDLIICEFRKTLPEKIAEIEQLLILATHENADVRYIAEMHRFVHSLVGSSGTFGYMDISNKAKDLLYTLSSILAGNISNKKLLDTAWSHLISLRNAVLRNTDPMSVVPSGKNSIRDGLDSDINVAPLNIMLASDDTLFCHWLNTSLEHDNHHVTICNNGHDCIKETLLRPYDAVLLEVVMPRMNGYETAKQIRLQSQEKFLPIIFITTLENDDSVTKCILAGGDDVISKPLSLVVLKTKLFAFERIKSQILSRGGINGR